MSPQKEYYTWDQFDEDCKKIAQWAREHGGVDRIYGVPRGGLVPAVMLSHILEWPLVFKSDDIIATTLIIDDIVDTGNTITRLFQKLGRTLPVASLHFDRKSIITPDFYCNEKTAWIVYPWETDASSKYDGTV